jgi:hypothetical protein
LGPKYFGPFKIVAQVGDAVYQLQLPSSAWIYDMFHLGLLKKYCGEEPTGPGNMPPLRHCQVCLEPEEVSKSRLARGQTEVVVHWLGKPAANTSWVYHAEFWCHTQFLC